MRVRFYDGSMPVFGPGVYRLLVLIEDTGSLNRSAQAMGMSYSKAWRIIRDAESHLGVQLLERRAGGAAGGGSVLTDAGRTLVERYAQLQGDLEAALDALFTKHFGDQPWAGPGASEEPASG